jgi:hypothetical protein
VLTLDAGVLRDALVQVVCGGFGMMKLGRCWPGVFVHRGKQVVRRGDDIVPVGEKRIELEGEEPKKFSAIVPARTMQELIRLCGDASGESSCTWMKTRRCFGSRILSW